MNTLGAAAGALLTGFVVLGTLGYEVAVYVGALLNLIVGACALLVASVLHRAAARMPERAISLALGRVPGRVWLWSLLVFASGFLIISLEIVWFRVLGLLMQTNAYAFSMVLAAFLTGDALGIVGGAWIVRGVADPRRFFLWLQGAMALYALASLDLIYLAHSWLDLSGWFVTGISYTIYGHSHLARILAYAGITFFAVLPPAFLLGMSFPIAQKAVQA